MIARAGAAAAFLAAVVAVVCGIRAASRAAPVERSEPGLRARGEAIFSGRRPLRGRIRGHESDLPPEVVACRQCHLRSPGDGGPAAAPVLDRKLLLQLVQRRGAPPSVYDLPSFCKLLRTGIDPAYVLIDRIMPTYDMSDTDCAALWQVVTR